LLAQSTTLKGKTYLDLERRVILKCTPFQGAHWVHVAGDRDRCEHSGEQRGFIMSLQFTSQLNEHTFVMEVNLQGNISKSVVTGISFAGIELFEVFVAVRIAVAVFLDVKLCSFVDR
jgi:hypothetical protein